MKLFVYTLGCRLNQCESEAIADSFERNGHVILHDYKNADLVIVNTCTVTSKAEQKARREIRLFASFAQGVLVTGCYAQMNGKELEALRDNVVVVPLSKKAALLKLPLFLQDHYGFDLLESLRLFVGKENGEKESVFDYAPQSFSYHCRAYLKVQDGCDNNCGFCRVHIARGPSVSLDSDIAVQRALELERKGYHEIVLTGVNLTMFDHRQRGLGGLLEKMLGALGPDVRLRLSSLEPDHIDSLLLEQLKDNRMQPYFHIPLQSTSDKVIKRINRHYESAHLENVIGQIRQIKDDPFLACDIITGLPGEEEEDFEITRNFLIRHGFALFHVFPFSPRPGTALEKARDRVPEAVRDERAAILRKLSATQNSLYCEAQVGKDLEVILEEKKDGQWFGLTGNYLKVKVDNLPQSAEIGHLFKVKLVKQEVAICTEH